MAKLQKVFYFSSDRIKKLIESRLDDLAYVDQRSTSYIIEHLLLDGMYPDNMDARYITTTYLYGDRPDNIQSTLFALFSNNAAGTNWDSRHTNYMPLVRYCIDACDSDACFDPGNPHMHHLIDNWAIMVQRIAKCARLTIEINDRNYYLAINERAQQLLDALNHAADHVTIKDMLEVISDCWPMLYWWTYTYRTLADIVTMMQFDNSADARLQLYNIIDQLSREWDTKKEADK